MFPSEFPFISRFIIAPKHLQQNPHLIPLGKIVLLFAINTFLLQVKDISTARQCLFTDTHTNPEFQAVLTQFDLETRAEALLTKQEGC